MKKIKLKNRKELPLFLNNLGLNGRGVEVGCGIGGYSELILKKSNLKKLYSLDAFRHFSQGYRDIANASQLKHYIRWIRAKIRLRKFKKRSKIIRSLSSQGAKKFRDQSLDFVYIDANRSYEKVKEDIQAWSSKVKKGGVFAGHDYLDGVREQGLFGVKKAVDEFVKETKNKLHLTGENDFRSWFIIKK